MKVAYDLSFCLRGEIEHGDDVGHSTMQLVVRALGKGSTIQTDMSLEDMKREYEKGK